MRSRWSTLSEAVQDQLKAIAGPRTDLARRRGMHIDIVGNGIPFLPHAPRWHDVPRLNRVLASFEIRALDVVDVVVSKLKPFRASDRQDIDAMVSRGLVPHDQLIARFKSAVDEFSYDARAPDIPGYIENLHEVERDMLGVPESEIELPSWVDR